MQSPQTQPLKNDLRSQLKDARIVHRLRPAEDRRRYRWVRQGPEETSAEGVPRGQYRVDICAIGYVEKLRNEPKVHALAFERNVLADAQVYRCEFRASDRIPAGARRAVIGCIAVVAGVAGSDVVECPARLSLGDQPELPIIQETFQYWLRDGVGIVKIPHS